MAVRVIKTFVHAPRRVITAGTILADKDPAVTKARASFFETVEDAAAKADKKPTRKKK